ncbi:MAG: [FeFe] hydrogenase H-cluster radical SAM maturase HydE [Draconibacterium sp.]
MNRTEIIELLQLDGDNYNALMKTANEIKVKNVGNKVFFRGLVEFSNICSKDCYYCGIRKSSGNVVRYHVSDDEILDACRFAWEHGFGSVVLQSGELSNQKFVKRLDSLLRKIKQLSNNELGITLSCGEQTKETYLRWFESGAHRYLLRIESSNRELYYKIHPNTKKHSFENRLQALSFLKETGYQVGSGVMIGLPFQTLEDLADDLLFLKKIDIDMCGMGPYIEHENTPLAAYRNTLKSKQERFDLALKMIAILRLLMPDINIAASTALETLDKNGREKALSAGANIIMPNLTPSQYRENYFLYENKPVGSGSLLMDIQNMVSGIQSAGYEIGNNEWGDSRHFFRRFE